MKWKTEKRKIKDLKLLSKNPRKLNKNDANHLKQSLEKFGQCEPIVINSDNTIIGGHQRLKILKKLKYKEVYVYVPEKQLTEKEVEELNIRQETNVDSVINTVGESFLLLVLIGGLPIQKRYLCSRILTSF